LMHCADGNFAREGGVMPALRIFNHVTLIAITLAAVLTAVGTGSIVLAFDHNGEWKMGDIVKVPPKDEVTYFYLIERIAVASESQELKGRGDITKLVRQEGGKCRLYKTSGSAFDFVSVVTGITTIAAIRIAEEIEKRGVVKATLMPSIEIFHRK
jgi:hypothetical protein